MKIEERIIHLFKTEEDNGSGTIAKIVGLDIHKVDRILNAYLSKKKNAYITESIIY